MKTISLLALTSLLLTGCIGVTVNRHAPETKSTTTVVVPVTTEDSATIAEIDAAGALSFDDSRVQALRAIAQRPTLSPTVQVHLVNTIYRRLQFEDSKVQLLRAVIANPSFGDTAKQSIVTQLKNLAFDDSRRQVLTALNARAAEPPTARIDQ